MRRDVTFRAFSESLASRGFKYALAMLRTTRLDAIDLVQQKSTRVPRLGARFGQRHESIRAKAHVTRFAIKLEAKKPCAADLVVPLTDLQIDAIANCVAARLR